MSETASRLTLAEFIERHGVKMTATTTDHNPHMDNDRQMDHWRCTLTCGGRRMVLTFSKGMGHHGKPAELREVLSCIAMITPFVCIVVLLFVVGDLLNLLGRTLNTATEAASRGLRHLAAIVGGGQP